MGCGILSSPVVLRTILQCSLLVTSITLWTAATICRGKRPMTLLMRYSLFEGGQLKFEKRFGSLPRPYDLMVPKCYCLVESACPAAVPDDMRKMAERISEVFVTTGLR